MKNKVNHIYWFAHFGLLCPSTRYRGVMPLKRFEDEGIPFDFIYPQRSLKGIVDFLFLYLKVLFFRKQNSVIVIQKVWTNRMYANALKLLIKIRNKRTVYDLDDAEQFRRNISTVNYFLKNCSSVSVGSEYLQRHCLGFNEKVFIQTSPVSVNGDFIEKDKKNERLHIGWVGDFGNGNSRSKIFSHKTSLYQLLFPILIKMDFPIKLSLIGVKNKADIPEVKQYFSKNPNIELEIPTSLDWENDYWLYQKIAQFDIGISLMLKHPFNEAKSAFKAKQYLICGVPVIASNIGEHNNFVFDNFNGFICNNDEDVMKAIYKIKEMSDNEYDEISKNCLKNKPSFSVNRYCQNFIELF